MGLSTTILLVRHGQTAGNMSGLDVGMSGWTDTSLTPLGLRQALATARRLARGAHAPVVYTSPLQRALCTAAIVASRCRAVLQTLPDLREIHCGEADGLTIRQVMSRFPRHWERNLAQDEPSFRWPGGESYVEFRARCVAAVKSIARAHAGERVLVVTHTGVITQILGWLLGRNPARWDEHRVRNCSVTELAFQGDSARLVDLDRLDGFA